MSSSGPDSGAGDVSIAASAGVAVVVIAAGVERAAGARGPGVEMSRAPHVGYSRQLKAAAARGEADAVPRCGVRVSPPLAVVNFAIDSATRLLGGSRRKWYQENPCIVPVRLVAKSGGQEVPIRGWRSEKREP
ncbi:hypothetical protein HPB48_019211 [Haemaphysalis longicornis]|uniref:Uncharacterized protein n=1 Tax=Haemaphysalis longicornis TaxID=44386 RepID=A0A9J6GXQ2_HAELO|nr:hypothetical protein HPB48_019211 [Haemaphysalis longicornis]